MWETAFGTIGIEEVAARDAKARLQTIPGIMQPSMDDLAVARGSLGADPALLLEHHDLAPGERQGPRHGKADDAGTDHHAFNRFAHHRSRTARPCLPIPSAKTI